MRTLTSAVGLTFAAAILLAGCTGATASNLAASRPPTSMQPPTSAPMAPRTAPPATRTPSAPAPAAPAPTTPAPAAPAPLANAEAVVTQYYQDITDHDYAAAWALGGANIAGEPYAQYVAGFATTSAISLGTVSSFGSNQVSAVLNATQTDGTVKVFNGTYTVSGGVLVGASITQTQ
jgi:hypothetical protein